VKMDLDEDLPPVMCCADEINQIFLILLANAAQSITEFTGDLSGKRGLITIKSKLAGDNVIISISDTGGGIPLEIRDRIFEPFFTTKPAGLGTGQGLSIAKSIVTDRHGGSLEFESEIGKGTIFTISLPLERKKDDGRQKKNTVR